VVGGLFELLPVLLLVPQLPAVTGGLFELLVVVLQDAATLPGDIAFGDVGDSLHPISTAVASRSEVPIILIAISSLIVGEHREEHIQVLWEIIS